MSHDTSVTSRSFVRSSLVSFWILVTMLLDGKPLAVAEGSWEPLGLSGGGGMFSPAISPVDPDLMMINCDMGAAYISRDGGHNWRMIHHRQLRSDTRCRPAFHPADARIIYASSRGQLRMSRDGGSDVFALR